MELYEKTLAWWKEKKIETDAQLAEVLNGHSIAFAYHSGKIENDKITYNDTRDIFEHDGVTAYTGDLRTLFEIRNAKLANELFLTSFGEKRRTKGLQRIRKCHKRGILERMQTGMHGALCAAYIPKQIGIRIGT